VIAGTSSADAISVGRITGDTYDQARVSVGRQRWYFNTSEITRIDIDDPAYCLVLFKSNRDAGLILFGAMLIDAAV